VAILLIPVLLGAFQFQSANVGGVKLLWFGVWLEIVWLTLWAGRILAKCLPWPIGIISSLFTNNSKKWRDMGKQLEVPGTIFFWALAVEISFLPTMTNHHLDGSHAVQDWEHTMNKVLICFLVLAIINFVEKIIIQLIAISFHLRTYADRIDINKFQIASLVKLYQFSKEKISEDDSDFEDHSPEGTSSGARTPGQLMKEAQKSTKEAFNMVGDVAGKIAGDFTGRQIVTSDHPHQVVLTLLGTPNGSQVLARRLYRTFGREETQTVHAEDLKDAFESDDEAEAAFSMFDKDLNGDISMEELEAVCVEIGRERKSIMASLKDLDSVVSKLDDVFMFIVLIIAILVFVSVLATSAATVLASAGSTLLALSWLFSVTAQEFLQSIIFVFVKHPFDVGDRVSIYGNTGAKGLGDDYFVKEIALLYTEFKKMEGHIVQAPNSYLNTLFILNQRRSGGLAEAVPIVVKFGTTLEQIEALRTRLLEFVTSEKREYQCKILTELREVFEAHQLTINVVFFYKSNWQNELLRLKRRNKFICALMVSMQELGIEGPRMRYPGMKESFPMYLQNIPHMPTPGTGHGGHPDNPAGWREQQPLNSPLSGPLETPTFQPSSGDFSTRNRGESLAAMGRRVDFSLGMRDLGVGDLPGDVYEDRKRQRVPQNFSISPNPTGARRNSQESRRSAEQRRRRASDETGNSSALDDGRSSVSRNSRSQHRNRFFGRGRGVSDIEAAMADIPENAIVSGGASSGGPSAAPGAPAAAGRMDPRTGTLSSKAVRMSDEVERVTSRRRGTAGEEDAISPLGPHRSETEDWEMRRMR
jgi:small-conductance mechanosensitive channel